MANVCRGIVHVRARSNPTFPLPPESYFNPKVETILKGINVSKVKSSQKYKKNT
jgi:hypothetical protein